jgi:large conductance mechanosensitive channel
MSTVREEFVKFINQGNLIQLAIAFVIGAAFAAVMTAFVTDLVTPLIGAVIHVNLSAWTYTLNGSVFLQGAFVNELISFVTIALVIFFLIALPYQRWKDKTAAKTAATTRACPECLSQIPLAAKRCSFCTTVVAPLPPGTPGSPGT